MPVGQPISKKVVKQLHAREAILGGGKRTPEQIAWMTSRNVFVRLSSSVNLLSDEEAIEVYNNHDISKVSGNPTLAKNNVMYSLGLAPDASKEDFTLQQNIGAPNPATNLTKNTGLGIRPGSGITNVTVKSKNTYGTLREAEISLKIWSQDELELLDELYFRPGYSLLLEWGHTHYYLSDQNEFNAEILTVTDFFQSGKSFEDIEKKIKKLRKKSDFNYDGMMGYCSNFSWSLSSDGSYDATVKIVSRGAIIESLLSNKDAGIMFPAKYFNSDENSEEGKKQRKSPFHFILNAMEKIGAFQGGLNIYRESLVAFVPELDQYLPKQDIIGTRAVSDLADTGMIFEDSVELQWITLGTFCELINNLIMPHDGGDRKLALMNTEYDEERIHYMGKQDIVQTSYITHNNHFSVDPYVCFLPTIPTDPKIKKEAIVDLGFGDGVQPGMIEALKKQRGARLFLKKYDSEVINNTLDISVSNYFLYEVLDSIYDQEEGDKSLFAIFKGILGGINDVLGGINELDLYFNEEDNRYYIIDRKTQLQGVEIPELRVSGLNHSVIDLQISSKISNEMSSMISIASQSTQPNSAEDIGAMQKWNLGKIDRFLPTKSVDNKEDTNKNKEEYIDREKEQMESWLDDLDDTFGHFCNRALRNQKYRKSDHDALKSYHKTYNQKQLNLNQKAKGLPALGVIPLELSMKLEGISGLRIAESFRVDTIVLPRKYKKYSYIITGLDHAIENNRWITNIKTQFYISEKPSQAEINAAKAAQSRFERYAEEQSRQNSGGLNVPTLGPKDLLDGDVVDYSLLEKAVRAKGYEWFTEPHMLNIVGIRNMKGYSNTSYGRALPGTNQFDDLICVAYIDEAGNKKAEAFPASTDPGFSALTKPSNPQGTAILKEGQYKDCWSIGKHGGSERTRHIALRQTGGKVTVYRDKTKDHVYNLDDRQVYTGYFGINIHKGSVGNRSSSRVGNWSEGCQIFKNGRQQQKFMQLCQKQVDKRQHKYFTYSLLNTLDPVIKDANLV